jgi:hypothetical protein
MTIPAPYPQSPDVPSIPPDRVPQQPERIPEPGPGIPAIPIREPVPPLSPQPMQAAVEMDETR